MGLFWLNQIIWGKPDQLGVPRTLCVVTLRRLAGGNLDAAVSLFTLAAEFPGGGGSSGRGAWHGHTSSESVSRSVWLFIPQNLRVFLPYHSAWLLHPQTALSPLDPVLPADGNDAAAQLVAPMCAALGCASGAQYLAGRGIDMQQSLFTAVLQYGEGDHVHGCRRMGACTCEPACLLACLPALQFPLLRTEGVRAGARRCEPRSCMLSSCTVWHA